MPLISGHSAAPTSPPSAPRPCADFIVSLRFSSFAFSFISPFSVFYFFSDFFLTFISHLFSDHFVRLIFIFILSSSFSSPFPFISSLSTSFSVHIFKPSLFIQSFSALPPILLIIGLTPPPSTPPHLLPLLNPPHDNTDFCHTSPPPHPRPHPLISADIRDTANPR